MLGVSCLVFCTATVFAMPVAGQAQSGDPHADLPEHRPRLVCTNSVFNFGRVENTNDVVNEFILRNEGDVSLLIISVRTDCGCAVGRLKDTTIRPGEEAILEGKLVLKGRNGPQRKRIIVESNDPEQPVIALFFEGEAYSEIEVKPDRLHLGCITLDSADVFTVDITCHATREYDVLFVDVTSPYFVAKAIKLGWGRHRIIVEAQPPFQPGRIDGTVMVWTDNPAHPRIDIPIQGRAVSDLFLVPEELQIASTESNRVTRLAAFRSIRGRAFKVLNVIPPSDAVQVKVRPLGASAYRLELRFTPGPDINGRDVRILTDHPDCSEMILPIRIVQPGSDEAKNPLIRSKPE